MSNQQATDVISIKDLILKVQEYVAFLWSKKWWIALAVCLGVGLFIYRVYDKPGYYIGNTVLTINSSDGGASLGGVGSILGQIGLGGGGENNLIKVRALGQTYNVITNTLLDSAIIDKQADLIANHLLRIHKLNSTVLFEMDEALADFRFKHTNRDDFGRDEIRVLKFLYSYLRNKNSGLLEASEEEETGTIDFELRSQSSDLTLAILDRLYENLRQTYVSQSIAPQLRTLNELTIKSDSIKKRLTDIEYRIAAMQDRTIGLTSSRQLVQQANLQREASLLNSTYIEVLRNKETADFMLKTAKPDLQIIEHPILPLNYSGTNYPLTIIFGAIFGGMMSILGLSFFKAYQDIMHKEMPNNE